MSDYSKAIWIPNSNYFANTGKKSKEGTLDLESLGI